MATAFTPNRTQRHVQSRPVYTEHTPPSYGDGPVDDGKRTRHRQPPDPLEILPADGMWWEDEPRCHPTTSVAAAAGSEEACMHPRMLVYSPASSTRSSPLDKAAPSTSGSQDPPLQRSGLSTPNDAPELQHDRCDPSHHPATGTAGMQFEDPHTMAGIASPKRRNLTFTPHTGPQATSPPTASAGHRRQETEPRVVTFEKPSAFVPHGIRLREHFAGAEVSGINPGSPADTGLIFAGEIITRVGGVSVAGTPKATVQKLLHEQGRNIVIEVLAAPLPCTIFVARIKGEGLGFSIVVDDVAGVVRVAKLVRGSTVEQAGLRAGDRIVAINSQLILGATYEEALSALMSFRTMELRVIADRTPIDHDVCSVESKISHIEESIQGLRARRSKRELQERRRMEALQKAPSSSLWNKQALMTLPPGALEEVLLALKEDIDLLSVGLMEQLAAREQLAEESEVLESRIDQMVDDARESYRMLGDLGTRVLIGTRVKSLHLRRGTIYSTLQPDAVMVHPLPCHERDMFIRWRFHTEVPVWFGVFLRDSDAGTSIADMTPVFETRNYDSHRSPACGSFACPTPGVYTCVFKPENGRTVPKPTTLKLTVDMYQTPTKRIAHAMPAPRQRRTVQQESAVL